VLAAALLHPFEVCKGIEILESLHALALSLKTKYEDYAASQPSLPKLEFIRGSIMDVDWTDATFIFANSTCFGFDLIEEISKARCKRGTLAMSLTRPLLASHWQILESVKKRMSWGEATIYLQVKVDQEDVRRAQEEFTKALNSD
jgi:hypothetical protein